MKRTTISLPDDLSSALDREAHRRRRSRSEIAREALRNHLQLDTGRRRELPFAAVGHGESARPAAELEDELAETWAGDVERDSFSDRSR